MLVIGERSRRKEVKILSDDKKSRAETSQPIPSVKGKDTSKEILAAPANLEELKTLIGEESLPRSQKELNWLLKLTQEMVKKKGEDWVKKNRLTLLRQWEYVRTLL